MNARFASYSKAADGGPLKLDGYFGLDDRAVHNEWQRRMKRPVRTTGDIVTDEELAILGLAVSPPSRDEGARRYPLQGVGYNTNAFLAPDPTHSYVEMVNEGATEAMRLAQPIIGNKILIGYSGGADAMTEFLWRWPESRRHEIRCVIGIGDPSRRPGPTLLGDNPPGQGIAGRWAPEWVWPRYYNFCLPGDMYCCAPVPSLQPVFYQVLTRAELSFDFAVYLFNFFTSELGQILLGARKSDMPGAGVLSGIAGLVMPSGLVQAPMVLFGLLPTLINSLVSLIKFLATNDHGRYHEPNPAWGGSAIDRAVRVVTENVSSGLVFLFPGTWGRWDIGYPFDIGIRLYEMR